MKELTIEQKAKAYDEALERAKEQLETAKVFDYKEGQIAHDIRTITYAIFPELKEESEDEKIRKALIEYFNEQCDMSDWNGVYGYQVVAWLKKQGEHKKFRDSIQVGDEVTRNRDGVIVNLSQLNRVAKQGEQKPADKVEPKFKVKYAGNEYNVLDIKENMGITWYGIEDEPNHIDYVKANSCEIINVYGIKENGSPYPTKPAIFAGHNPSDEDMKEALRTEYEKGRADTIAEIGKKFDDCRRRQDIMGFLESLRLKED